MERSLAPSWSFALWLLMILVLYSHQADSAAYAEDELKLQTEELRQATINPSSYRETMAKKAKEAIESWGRWSKTKASEWLDVSLKNAKELAGLIADEAWKARDSMWKVAGKGKGKGKMTYSTVSEAKAGAGDAAEIAEAAGVRTEEEMDGGEVQSAKKAYQQAKERVQETYKRAQATMKEELKAGYEIAKEEESDATGNLGSKLRNQKKEL